MTTQTAPRSGRNFKSVIKGGNFLKPKKWEDWTEGDFIEGEYVNASELDFYGKPIYEFKVLSKHITGSDPTITSGDKIGIMPVYSNGSLAMQMDEASYGDICLLTYRGMATTSKGKYKGKPCHNIELQIDGYEGGDSDHGTDAGDASSADLLG